MVAALFRGLFRILEPCRNPRKCLWKWLFFGHSQFRLNMALWMLHNLETSQQHTGLEARGESKIRGVKMAEQSVRLGPREQQIVELLLQGCDNAEIASQLKMARRTVKAHFNRLFLRFGITGGIKRVKLATLLYRRQLCLQTNVMDPALPASVKPESSNLSPRV
jgi:DNA-binding CsgD family transcriptional regulator